MSLHTGLPHANKESQTSGQSAGVFGSSVSSAGQSAAASSPPPSPPPFSLPPSSFHKAPRILSSALLQKPRQVSKPSDLLLSKLKPTFPSVRLHPYARPHSVAPDWVLTFEQQNEKLQEDREKARVAYETDGSFQVDGNGYPIHAVYGANGELDFDPESGFM
jgi:hypothetical protein